jgi:hypothetical protein
LDKRQAVYGVTTWGESLSGLGAPLYREPCLAIMQAAAVVGVHHLQLRL